MIKKKEKITKRKWMKVIDGRMKTVDTWQEGRRTRVWNSLVV